MKPAASLAREGERTFSFGDSGFWIGPNRPVIGKSRRWIAGSPLHSLTSPHEPS